MKNLVYLFISGILLFQSSLARATTIDKASTCVLIFERDTFPITKAVRRIYDAAPDAYVKTYATPEDILDCADAGVKEIIVVAHLVQFGKDGVSRLGFVEKNAQGDSLHMVLEHPFDELLAKLQEQQKNNRQTLEKVRMMSCGPGEVLQDYPALSALKGMVAFDQTPPSPFLSFIKGEKVVSFNKEWFAQDFNCKDMSGRWSTEANSWCESDNWPGCNRAVARYCVPQVP